MPQLRNCTPYIERQLVAWSNTTAYEWLTPWMSCDGIEAIRAVVKCKNASGANFQWQLVVQYAAVRADSPGQAVTLGAQQTNNGEYNPGDITTGISGASYMPANRLFRLGIAYGSAAASVQQGDVSLVASWKQVGTDMGSRRVTLAISDNGDHFEPLTDWYPATFMTKVKAAFVLTSISPANGNLKYRLCYQTAATSVEQPSIGWTDLETAYTQPANTVTYEEHNSAEQAVNTSDMWIRLGVHYAQAGGVDTNYSAVLDAACSCR